MSIKPAKAEYSVGTTVHNQPLRLIAYHRGGQDDFELVQDAINQRDETNSVRGLTIESIRNIAEAAGLKVS